MKSSTLNLEQELRELNERIGVLDAEAAEKKGAADNLVAGYRTNGVNPLLDKEAFEAVDEAYKVGDTVAEEAAEFRRRRDAVMERLGRSSSTKRASAGVGRRDLVSAITETPEYQRLLETGAFTGGGTAGPSIQLPGVEVLAREEALARMSAGIPLFRAATAVVGDMIDVDQRLYPPVPIPVRPIRVLDLIGKSTTDSDTIMFTVETLRTDNAAETALGTAYGEASYEYEDREAPVRDVGHWTPAHRSNLADRGQIQALLEGRLSNGVERRLESQVVAGNGVGQNMTGILETSGIASIDRDGTGSELKLEAIHRGITAVRLNLFGEPDAIGINPTNYEECVFEKGDDGQFLLGPASQQTSRTIWGFPASITAVFPEDTSLVGNYAAGAMLWMRSGVAVRASDSHANFFTERRVALLAELRAAFAAWQPEAFAEVLLA